MASGTSSLSALSLLEYLEGVRIIALDRPGYGLSDPVDVPRERFREAAVEFLDETVDELGLESFALAGGSMGGTWALWYALARPERVRRLALLGSAPLPARYSCAGAAVSDGGTCRRRPTLLIWGDHDPVGTVDVAQAVASLIPDAQLDVVAAGHAVWLGDPKRISGLLCAFVRSGGDR
jgi:pimeloyl-ACP methyl ester carboxylesterase